MIKIRLWILALCYTSVAFNFPSSLQITVDVNDDPRVAYCRQAKNGLYIRMALLKLLLVWWWRLQKFPFTFEIFTGVNLLIWICFVQRRDVIEFVWWLTINKFQFVRGQCYAGLNLKVLPLLYFIASLSYILFLVKKRNHNIINNENKFKKSQVLVLSLLTILFIIAPLLSSSLRPTYIYFITNLLMIALGAETGVLSFFSKPSLDHNIDKKNTNSLVITPN